MPNFIHLTSWLSGAGGGIPPVIRALTAEYRRQSLDGLIAGIADPSGAPPAFPSDWPVLAGRIAGPAAFGYSPELARALSTRVNKDSVIHVHGLWMYPGVLARQLSRSTGAVRMISPHGMLSAWAIRHSPWKKRLAAWTFERENLRTASCLHALCSAEAEDIRAYGLTNTVAIIPNGVDIPDSNHLQGKNQKAAWAGQVEKGRKILLYLGRLHPKKGLVNLLKAWAQNKRAGWMLVIAGWDQDGHQSELQKLVSELQLSASVLFVGPQFDEAKAACYRDCDAFILPSFSEGLPMVVLEAWSHGKPVVMTPECNLPEGFAAGAAVKVDAKMDGITRGLGHLFEMSDDQRREMGQRGLALVKDRFTWPQVATRMRAVQEWLLGNGPKPESVVTSNQTP